MSYRGLVLEAEWVGVRASSQDSPGWTHTIRPPPTSWEAPTNAAAAVLIIFVLTNTKVCLLKAAIKAFVCLRCQLTYIPVISA